LLNVAPFDVPDRVKSLLSEVQQLKKQVAELDAAGVLSADSLIERGEEIDGVHVIVADTPGANVNLMRQLIDQIRKKSDKAAVLLAAVQASSKVTVVAGLSRDVVEMGGHAGNWVKATAAAMGGGGGGRPDMAQAGGKSPEKLPEALETARTTIRSMLQQN
jgi:alanyl-tRNA synthetase